MEITILGPGCINCNRLAEMARTAAGSLCPDAAVLHVSDISVIMRHVTATPGLVIDGVVKHSGLPLPSIEQVRKMIMEEMR